MRRPVAIVVLACLLVIAGAYAFSAVYVMRNLVSVYYVNLEVYVDPECTIPVKAIDWGNVTINEWYMTRCYVKTTGTSEAVLRMYTRNFEPADAVNVIELQWDADGYVISPGEVKPVMFLLRANSSALLYNVYSFRFDIVLEAVY